MVVLGLKDPTSNIDSYFFIFFATDSGWKLIIIFLSIELSISIYPTEKPTRPWKCFRVDFNKTEPRKEKQKQTAETWRQEHPPRLLFSLTSW